MLITWRGYVIKWENGSKEAVMVYIIRTTSPLRATLKELVVLKILRGTEES